MTEQPRVLITGCEGFIGKALRRSLAEAGCEVWGIDQLPPVQSLTLQVDLLDCEAVRKAAAEIPPISILIHTAALAHNQRLPRNQSRVSINARITDTLLQAFERQDPRLVFLRSVAVYGEGEQVFSD